jgi:hypothetical protein
MIGFLFHTPFAEPLGISCYISLYLYFAFPPSHFRLGFIWYLRLERAFALHWQLGDITA